MMLAPGLMLPITLRRHRGEVLELPAPYGGWFESHASPPWIVAAYDGAVHILLEGLFPGLATVRVTWDDVDGQHTTVLPVLVTV